MRGERSDPATRLHALAIAAACAAALAACAPPYVVLSRAHGDPFSHARVVRLMPVATEGARVVPRLDPIAPNPAASRALLLHALVVFDRAFADAFTRGLAPDVGVVRVTAPDPDAVVVAPRLVEIDPGFYKQVADVMTFDRWAAPSRVDVVVRLTPRGARTYDEIDVRSRTFANEAAQTADERLARDGAASGAAAAAYVGRRLRGE